MNTRLEKFEVCDQCYSVGIRPGCICSYDKYKTIKLEFKVCECCDQLINDWSPPDTPFNKEQINNHHDD